MKKFSVFFCFLLLFGGCAHNEGTIRQTFETDRIWVESKPGEWRIVDTKEIKTGEIIEGTNIFQPIREIEVIGYRDAKQGANIATDRHSVNVNAGFTHEPPKPESSGDFLLGWVTAIAFSIGGLASIGAVVFGFFFQDRRIAGTLFLVGIAAIMVGALLMFVAKVLAAIPLWLMVSTFFVVVLMLIGLGFGFGMKEGWLVRGKQEKTKDFS